MCDFIFSVSISSAPFRTPGHTYILKLPLIYLKFDSFWCQGSNPGSCTCWTNKCSTVQLRFHLWTVDTSWPADVLSVAPWQALLSIGCISCPPPLFVFCFFKKTYLFFPLWPAFLPWLSDFLFFVFCFFVFLFFFWNKVLPSYLR